MWTTAPTPQSELFHYSEEPDIARFVPHVPATHQTSEPYVWAVEARHAPLYWFPRACPRVTVWANHEAQRARLRALFATDRERVQYAPSSERDKTQRCRLYEYAFEPDAFLPWPEAEGQWVAREVVVAKRVTAVGPLEARQLAAAVDLRWTDDLASARDAVLVSGLPFSIVRYRNYVEHREPA
ncbi:MAG: DUF6886 family protein [Polyangiales bacterium]